MNKLAITVQCALWFIGITQASFSNKLAYDYNRNTQITAIA